MAEFDPLLRELQTNNGLTRELLREKREDDTPKSLFMGNMFEIFTQYDIFKRRTKRKSFFGSVF